MNIWLNMIVKNEEKNIIRCLTSVAPFISRWVICDTGSTDNTKNLIEGFLRREKGIIGDIFSFEFKNFEQARNLALEFVCQSADPSDYILLCDADMELHIREGKSCVGPQGVLDLMANAYRLEQVSDSLRYWNVRLIRADSEAKYVGVTHEFVSLPGPQAEKLTGLYFRDYQDGGSKGNKAQRDRELLEKAVQQNPRDARSMFYLAQTYKDMGQKRLASSCYEERATMGGYQEEVWYSKYQLARLQPTPETRIQALLDCYNERPNWLEPLYHAAVEYRGQGKNDIACALAEACLQAPPDESGDLLFHEQEAYSWGPWQELSICGYHSKIKQRKEVGRTACAKLAVDRRVPSRVREVARRNWHFYARGLHDLCPTAEIKRIAGPTLMPGYHITNPSIFINTSGQLVIVAREVNYTIRSNGSYDILDPNNVVRSRYWTFTEGHGWHIDEEEPQRKNYPVVDNAGIVGREDMRPFVWDGDEWYVCTCADIRPDWRRQIVIADCWASGTFMPQQYESHINQKNWCPITGNADMYFIYSADPTVILKLSKSIKQCEEVDEFRSTPLIALDHLRGGTQAIPFHDGYLYVTHEVQTFTRRSYMHRFVWLDDLFCVQKISEPFWLHAPREIEFAAGLVAHEGKLKLTFGYQDNEAWMAELDPEEVWALLLSCG
jgi:tetratricopeptide (TPR) repeat protein